MAIDVAYVFIANLKNIKSIPRIYLEECFPENKNILRVKNRNKSNVCIICSKVTVKMPLTRVGIFIINSEHSSHLFLMFLFLDYHDRKGRKY